MKPAETINDILREMRDPENNFLTNNDLRDLADRIEAALKRERLARLAVAAWNRRAGEETK